MLGLIFHYQDFSAGFQEGRYTFMAAINMEMWRQTAKAFGCTHMIAISKEPIVYEHTDSEITYEYFSTLQEAFQKYSDAIYVYLESERVIPGSSWYDTDPLAQPVSFEYLDNFVHPVAENVIYTVGPDYITLPTTGYNLGGGKNKLVTIKTNYAYALWSIVAAAIALRDRWYKLTK